MSVKITRDTGFYGMASKVKLFEDGHEVALISHEETIQLDVDNPEVILQVKGFGIKSNKIKVNDGEELIIQSGKYNFILHFSFLLSVIIIPLFIRDFKLRTLMLLIDLILYFFIMYKIDYYWIEKL